MIEDESKENDDKEEEESNSGGTVLKPEGIIDAGMKLLIENPDYSTCLHFLVDDFDFESIYPTMSIVCNVSRETALFAVKQINKSISDVRDCFSHVIDLEDNAIYLSSQYFKLPSFNEMNSLFLDYLNKNS